MSPGFLALSAVQILAGTLVPLALAKGGRFRTTEWTPHSESQKHLLGLFLGTRVTVEGDLVTVSS